MLLHSACVQRPDRSCTAVRPMTLCRHRLARGARPRRLSCSAGSFSASSSPSSAMGSRLQQSGLATGSSAGRLVRHRRAAQAPHRSDPQSARIGEGLHGPRARTLEAVTNARTAAQAARTAGPTSAPRLEGAAVSAPSAACSLSPRPIPTSRPAPISSNSSRRCRPSRTSSSCPAATTTAPPAI